MLRDLAYILGGVFASGFFVRLSAGCYSLCIRLAVQVSDIFAAFDHNLSKVPVIFVLLTYHSNRNKKYRIIPIRSS